MRTYRIRMWRFEAFFNVYQDDRYMFSRPLKCQLDDKTFNCYAWGP